MIDESATGRGRRWQAFYEEDGGLRDMLAGIRQAYFDRMSALEPWEADKIAKLAMANRIAQVLDDHIKAIQADGRHEERAQAHANKIAAIPAAKRKILGI